MTGRMLIVALFAAQICYSQPIISTIAGNGTFGFGGDGSAATSASVKTVFGIAIDSSSNLLFSDFCNNRIRKINTSNIVNTIAGNSPISINCNGGYIGDGSLALNAELYHPTGLILDSIGNVFFADAENNRVRKIDIQTGIISTIAGTGTFGYTGDGNSALLAELGSPVDLVFDNNGNLLVVDKGNACIRKINANGIITTIAGTGNPGYNGDGGLADTSQLNEPYGIAIDQENNILIADEYNYRLRKVNQQGIIHTIAGNGLGIYNGDGIAANAAQITLTSIALDQSGNIFIADYGSHRIRKIDKNTGIISTVVGIGTAGFSGDGGLAVSAELNHPVEVAFDKHGNLYISDYQNKRIRKVSYIGETKINGLISANAFTISPNPANAQINISASKKLKEVVIANAIGQVVMKEKSAAEKMSLDISYLRSGVYFVTVTDADGVKYTQKVVKE